jgi:MFS family permease
VIPGVVGPALAGIVADLFHWRYVFLGLLPLIAVTAALTLPAIRAVRSIDPPAEAEASAARRRLPVAVLLAIGAGMTVGGLTDARLWPGLPLAVAGIAIGLPAFNRLTPPGTFRAARGLPAAVLLRGLMTFTFFAADVYVPLALEDWRGLSATEAGLALTAATLSWTSGAWVQAHYIGRLGARRFVGAGAAVVTIGIVGFAAILSPSIPIVFGVIGWAIAGLGMGLCYSPLSLVVLSEAPEETQGAATAGLQLSDVLGTSLGAGVGGAIIAFAHRSAAEGWVGLAGAFGVAAAVGVVAFALAGRLPGRASAPATDIAPAEPAVPAEAIPFERSEPTR